MEPIYTTEYSSPYGDLIIGSHQDQLCLCDWKYRKMRDRIDQRIKNGFKADFLSGRCSVINETIFQLEQYFSQERQQFSIPMLTIGTAFQKSVWHELQKIPYGETISYLTLAKRLGNKAAIRAVASANGANAISILIPCHRIIGSDGQLTGYAGGLPTKSKLLNLENDLFSAQRSLL